MKIKLSLLSLFLLIATLANAQKKSDSLNACWLVAHQINPSFIQRNARAIITKGKDDCVLELINKIVDSTSKKEDGRSYWNALASIAKISDGYVSEYFDDIGVKLFYKNFNNLFQFIYKNKSTFISPIEKVIIEAIGLKISDAKDKVKAKKELDDFLRNRVQALNMNAEQRIYTDQLKSKIYVFSDSQ